MSKIIDVNEVELIEEEDLVTKEVKPSEKEPEQEPKTEPEQVQEEEAPEEPPEEESKAIESTREIPSNIQLTELEYGALSKTFTTIKRLKETLKDAPHPETLDQINFLEIAIWDDIVKRFGFTSVEEAQSEKYDFNIKEPVTAYFIECRKK